MVVDLLYFIRYLQASSNQEAGTRSGAAVISGGLAAAYFEAGHDIDGASHKHPTHKRGRYFLLAVCITGWNVPRMPKI
jgi:hypothetical protein